MAKYNELTWGQTEALVNKLGGVAAVAKILSGDVVVKLISTLLNIIGTITVPATTLKFVAKDKFVVNTRADAKVKIAYVWDNFQTWFLPKVEEPRSETALRYATLVRGSVDGQIIAELGGEVRAEVTLFEVFALMERQGNGEDGVLLTNGYANIFYVRDTNGLLRAVGVCWYGGGWNVDAGGVSSPDAWDAGDQVFSRNS